MKKIAMVIAEIGMPGGAERVAVDLAQEFYARDYDVVIITFGQLGEHEQRHQVNAREIRVNAPEKVGGLFTQIGVLINRSWQFHKIFRQEKFDYIYSFLEASNVPCVMATPKAVLSIHLDPHIMTKKEWFIFKWLYPRARKVIAVSKKMQDMLEEKANLKNVKCVYNPVNSEKLKNKSTEAIVINKSFILAVGRLEKQKRFDILIDAYHKTYASTIYPLIILGSGSQELVLREKIKTLNLEDKILLMGLEENPYKYMAKAEFLIMSSDYEGYPLVLIEALTLGCPIVSTDCPTGPAEIVIPHYNGLLVEKGNADALAKGIDCLAQDQNLLEALRKNTTQSVINNDIKKVADVWLSV